MLEVAELHAYYGASHVVQGVSFAIEQGEAVALGGRPRLLLLDEPSSGMSAHERAGLGELLKRVVNTATVVMAEHDVHVVRSVASRVTAFAEGRKIAEGSADEVFESADVKRVFLRGRRDA